MRFPTGEAAVRRKAASDTPSPSDPYAALRLLAGAAMISFAPVFVRLTDVPPTASAFYRTLFGGLMLVALLRIRGERLWAGGAALIALICAGLFFALDLWAWHRSIWYVGPGLATLLANFQVFVLACAGIALFGERLRIELAIAIPLALAGLALIVGLDRGELPADYLWGVGFGLLTAVAYAAYLLSLRAARMRAAGASPAGDLAVASLFSALALWLSAGLEGVSLAIPTVADGALLVAYALVAQVLGWLLISSSLREVPASTVGLLLLLQPTLAFVWDILIFQRPFGSRELLGALLALSAIYLGGRRQREDSSGQQT
jgi:drug/metabolite transporter (DMT)-like permease